MSLNRQFAITQLTELMIVVDVDRKEQVGGKILLFAIKIDIKTGQGLTLGR